MDGALFFAALFLGAFLLLGGVSAVLGHVNFLRVELGFLEVFLCRANVQLIQFPQRVGYGVE